MKLFNVKYFIIIISLYFHRYIMTDTINESSCTSLSVVAYDENNVSNLYRNIRNFTFDEHTISIEQNWRDIGVAAVVWDAVS